MPPAHRNAGSRRAFTCWSTNPAPRIAPRRSERSGCARQQCQSRHRTAAALRPRLASTRSSCAGKAGRVDCSLPSPCSIPRRRSCAIPKTISSHHDLQGGGILIWLGVHEIDQLLWMTGERIVEVQAIGRTGERSRHRCRGCDVARVSIRIRRDRHLALRLCPAAHDVDGLLRDSGRARIGLCQVRRIGELDRRRQSRRSRSRGIAYL